jgi:predicted N-acetyltransferase YhbS
LLDINVLLSDDVLPNMLDSFDRSQKTTKVLLNEEGRLIEKEDEFEDNWTLERKREIVQHFKRNILDGGAVIVAKQGTELIGFAVIEAGQFGDESIYRELSYIHVTCSARGQRIGEQLFVKAKQVAKLLGADKLYIGAHPAAETQHFYRKMGCVLAMEINEAIYRREIRDIQLEVTL